MIEMLMLAMMYIAIFMFGFAFGSDDDAVGYFASIIAGVNIAVYINMHWNDDYGGNLTLGEFIIVFILVIFSFYSVFWLGIEVGKIYKKGVNKK